MEDVMSAGYIVARENFKEAAKHVSAENDPVMFNLLYGLQSLTNQIEDDFGSLWSILRGSNVLVRSKVNRRRVSSKKKAAKKTSKKTLRRGRKG
jgi:hypothetical protein